MQKAFVLSSGGLDSTTCVSLAVANYGAKNVVTVSMRYGQKHDKELECAERVADYYGLIHKVIDFTKTGIFDESDCSLLKGSVQDIPKSSYAAQISEGEMVSTYVPFRNGLFLSSIASLAMSMYPDDEIVIMIGIHADDVAGSAYADCTFKFADEMSKAIEEGSYGHCTIIAPFVNKSKADVVAKGLELNTPYELTWSCYEGGEKPCGKCATCIDRAKAFRENNAVDPVIGNVMNIEAVEIMKEYVSWDDVYEFIDFVERQLEQFYVAGKIKRGVTGVYGLPRGGLCLAVMLSHRLNVPLLAAPVEGCLIVDDICDSGESLLHYFKNTSGDIENQYVLATMFYKQNELGVVPDCIYRTKTDAWIVFPWEC